VSSCLAPECVSIRINDRHPKNSLHYLAVILVRRKSGVLLTYEERRLLRVKTLYIDITGRKSGKELEYSSSSQYESGLWRCARLYTILARCELCRRGKKALAFIYPVYCYQLVLEDRRVSKGIADLLALLRGVPWLARHIALRFQRNSFAQNVSSCYYSIVDGMV